MFQEYIAEYMAKRPPRKASSSSLDLDDDAPEYDYKDEDMQTQKEFDDFKRWLDGNAPASSSSACPKCSQMTCQCHSMGYR